jgi:5'-nucleotidase
MHILLTNDDGIRADGLWALHRALARRNTVTVIAPDRERSAVGHGITLHTPLRVQQVDMNGTGRGIAVDGTPADCIKLAVLELMEKRPDMVISGINPGANVGININYSGTVSAAREAALYGIPAIAVSVAGHGPAHLDGIARFSVQLAETVFKRGLPPGTLLNVNFPGTPLEMITGVCVSRQSLSPLPERFEKRSDPWDRPYYWSGCNPGGGHKTPGTDSAALGSNFISITPIKCDMTDYGMLNELSSWDIAGPQNKE